MFRLQPAMAPQFYKTYAMRRPLSTHWTGASCEDADCPNFLYGWVTRVDESTDLGKSQAEYVRRDRTRKHAESRSPEGLTVFTFPAGQRCFTNHKLPLQREAVFLVKGGDHRGNPLGTRTRMLSARQWVDDFGEHQENLAELIRRG